MELVWGRKMEAQEQKQQRREMGLEARRSQMMTFGVQLGLVLLDGVLPGLVESVHCRQPSAGSTSG